MPRIHDRGAEPAKRMTGGGAGTPARPIGNHAMGRLLGRMRALRPPPPEPGGLSVRPPDDAFEREAHARATAGGGPPTFTGSPGHAPGGRPLDGATSRAIERSRGAGSALPDRIRRTLEPEFGVDLSPIRVQADTRARALTRAVGARAMTVGRTIWIGESGFSPDSRTGRDMLRHEVTHALQQSGVQSTAGGRGRMGRATAPTVQCLMTAEEVRRFGGSPGERDLSYARILHALDAYHGLAATDGTAVRRRHVTELEEAVDGFVTAHTGTEDLTRRQQLHALLDLKQQLLHARGERETASPLEALTHERSRVSEAGRAAIPAEAREGTTYRLRMSVQIDGERHGELATERALIGRTATGFERKYGDLDRMAAEAVADRYTDDWKRSSDGYQEREKYIGTLRRGMGGEGGHASVLFQSFAADGAPSDPISFGFWPLTPATDPDLGAPGEVRHPDATAQDPSRSRSRTLDVSHAQYRRGLEKAYAVLGGPPMYRAKDSNSVTFVRDVAEAMSVHFPPAYYLAPDRTMSRVWNPGDLFDAFRT